MTVCSRQLGGKATEIQHITEVNRNSEEGHGCNRYLDEIAVSCLPFERLDGTQSIPPSTEELFALLKADRIHPLIDRTVGFESLGNAMLDLYERQTVGRVLFDPRIKTAR